MEWKLKRKRFYLFRFLIELRHRFVHSNESPHRLIRYDALLWNFCLFRKRAMRSPCGQMSIVFSPFFWFVFSFFVLNSHSLLLDAFCSELIFGSVEWPKRSKKKINRNGKFPLWLRVCGDLWSYVRALSGSINREVKHELREVMHTHSHSHTKQHKKKKINGITTYPCDNIETENAILDGGYLIFQFDHFGPLNISFSCHVTVCRNRCCRFFFFLFFASFFIAFSSWLFLSSALKSTLLTFVFSLPILFFSYLLFLRFSYTHILLSNNS